MSCANSRNQWRTIGAAVKCAIELVRLGKLSMAHWVRQLTFPSAHRWRKGASSRQKKVERTTYE
jgi:hypothetical protein